MDGTGTWEVDPRADDDADGIPADQDCDDTNPAVSPLSPELCDGLDNDCNGLVDDQASDAVRLYPDGDRDGYGRESGGEIACPQDGWVETGGDCDDWDAAIHPETVWFHDDDGDGYGGELAAEQCEPITGAVTNDMDCDDTRAAISPDGTEICDTLDNDCDGLVDGDDDVDGVVFYADLDGDGWGDADVPIETCWLPDDAALQPGDCDDGRADIHPDAIEVCGDPVDYDCSPYPDNGCWTESLEDADRALTIGTLNGYDGPNIALLDGHVVVGEPRMENGRVSVLQRPWPEDAATLSDAALATVTGDGPGLGVQTFGHDLDGDGVEDLIVSAEGETGMGAVFVLNGPISGDVDTAQADGRIQGEVLVEFFGSSLDAGDVTGDGAPDLVAGAPWGYEDPSVFRGSAYIFEGPQSGEQTTADAAARIVGSADMDEAGQSVSVLGDHNGDGVADVAVGVPGGSGGGFDRGEVQLFWGPLSGTLDVADADHVLTGFSSYQYLGEGLTSADLDGDGDSELITYALSDPELDLEHPGVLYIHDGPLDGASATLDAEARLLGTSDHARFGQAIDHADIDGDGAEDLFVGAPGASTDAGSYHGAGYVFFGPIIGTKTADAADRVHFGIAGADRAGTGVVFASDVTGDAAGDLVLLATGTDEGGTLFGTSVDW